MTPNPNDVLFDAATRHAVYVQRYGGAVARRIVRLLERADADVRRQFTAADDGSWTQRRMELLIQEIEARLEILRAELRDDLVRELGEFAEYEAEFQARSHQVALAASARGVNAIPADVARAAALSRPFQGVHLRWATPAQHADALVRRRFAEMRDQIRMGFVEGESIPKIRRRILGTGALRHLDGVAGREARAAETIARTAVNHTSNAARQAFYDANPDVVQRIRWNSVLDGRTSPICRARDGRVYPADSGPRPPAHPNCRSTTVAVISGYATHPRPTYQGWLGEQPADVQDDILGPSRGRLFRKGGLTLDRFVDSKGGELTLEALRVRESAAFTAAGL